MSTVRVLVGNAQGRIHPDFGRQTKGLAGERAAVYGLGDLSPEGVSGETRTGCMPRRAAAGLGSRFSVRKTAERQLGPGGEQVLLMRVCPARISGTTAGAPVGVQSGCGIWSLRLGDLILCMPESGGRGALQINRTGGRDMGRSWPGCAAHDTGPQWQPGAGGMCLHTIILDPRQRGADVILPFRAAGAFRTDNGGKSWKPINKGLVSNFIPNPTAEVGHCVHHVAMHRERPGVLFMQKHWDVMRSDDAGESWQEGERQFAYRLWLRYRCTTRTSRRPCMWCRSKATRSIFRPEGKLRVYRSRTGGNEWEALTKGLPQKDCYVNVAARRHGVDSLDACGVYFGTTGGQVYASADAGDKLDARLCATCRRCSRFEVQTLT